MLIFKICNALCRAANFFLFKTIPKRCLKSWRIHVTVTSNLGKYFHVFLKTIYVLARRINGPIKRVSENWVKQRGNCVFGHDSQISQYHWLIEDSISTKPKLVHTYSMFVFPFPWADRGAKLCENWKIYLALTRWWG